MCPTRRCIGIAIGIALFMLAAILTGIALTGPAKAASPNLIDRGQPEGAIVLPDAPSRAEQFAAEEAQSYLKKMTGATIPIVKGTASAGKPLVIVGKTADSARAMDALRRHSTSQEACAVIGDGRQLFLVGNGETATIYAVWDWLESLGVRWILPTERGEYVPHRSTITIPTTTFFDAPAFTYRGPNDIMYRAGAPPEAHDLEHGIPADRLFSYRMRLNDNADFDPADAWAEVGSGHSYDYFLPPARYFKAHPDWYSEIGGNRNPSQLNFTSTDAARQFAQNVDQAIASQMRAGYRVDRLNVWVSPNDRPAVDESPASQQLIDSGGSASSMVVHFANLVATDVHETYPGARVVFYAYDNYARPPDKDRPGPDVCPQLTFWPAASSFNANPAHPMFSAENSRFEQYFKQWGAMSDHVSIYQYYGHYLWFTPYPQLTQIAHDFPILANDSRFYGLNSENHLNWGTQAPNFYLQAKMAWNPRLDVQKTMDDFYKAGFGPAAPAIKAYFETLQKKMDSLGAVTGTVAEIPTLLTPDVVQQCSHWIDEAEARIPGMDPGTEWRTRLVVKAWRASAKTAEALRLYASSAHPVEDRKTITRDLNSVIGFAHTDTGEWAFEQPVVDGALRNIVRTVGAPLDSLPPGSFDYSDYLQYGGGLKFHARVTGLEWGIWGCVAPAHGQGSIDIPFRAAPGRRINALTLNLAWAINDPAKIEASVTVTDGAGRTLELAPDIKAAGQTLAVPAAALGSSDTIHIAIKNLTGNDLTVLTNFNAHSSVE